MTRLVINKSLDRTLCVIKNFITIELENNLIRITDCYGVKEFNIFNIEFNHNYIMVEDSIFTSSNMYTTHKNSNKYTWYIHHSVWHNIRELIQLHVLGEIVYAVKNKVINIDDLRITYENDNFLFESTVFKVCDKFRMLDHSALLKDYQQIHLVGENSFIVLNYSSAIINSNIEIFKKDNLYYPNHISYIFLNKSAFHILIHFIAACLNTLKTENEYLLVSLLS
jgi:hypothetical protein